MNTIWPGEKVDGPLPREFVGFVWSDDWAARIGVLVEAAELADAVDTVRAFYGKEFHVSLWNEHDAEAPR